MGQMSALSQLDNIFILRRQTSSGERRCAAARDELPTNRVQEQKFLAKGQVIEGSVRTHGWAAAMA